MSTPFGAGPFGAGTIELLRDLDASTARRDMELSTTRLAELADGGTAGRLRVHRPSPTAAFSRRDSLAAGYPDAERAALAHGFEPVLRPVGGRLAAYGPGALVLDLIGRHPHPRADINARFALVARCLADSMRTLGVPAGVGAVPGEYCTGAYSVNAAGAKIAGTAQRLTRHGYLFSTVLLVTDPEPIRAVLIDAYAALGLDWCPRTVGCVAEHARGVTVNEVEDVVVAAFGGMLATRDPLAASVPGGGTEPP